MKGSAGREQHHYIQCGVLRGQEVLKCVQDTGANEASIDLVLIE